MSRLGDVSNRSQTTPRTGAQLIQYVEDHRFLLNYADRTIRLLEFVIRPDNSEKFGQYWQQVANNLLDTLEGPQGKT